jgi:tRNA (guanine10-N2)-dimethyltransferase
VKLLLELSMECESLARSEAVAAAEALGGKPKVIRQEPGVLVVETKADPIALANRLGLCHFVSEWVCTCEEGELGERAREIDVEGPIRVRSTKVGETKADLAGATRLVGGIVGKSEGVDLRHPKSDVRIVFSESAHVGRLIGTIDRASFEKRKNRYMPFFYPASLHPKFARALVNLTRTESGAKLLDPFCGTGAILTEADLVGLEAVGTDLSEKMIQGARKNLNHVRADATLIVSDVGGIAGPVGRVDGIATDPPYGKSTSTKGESIPALYRRAFDAFSEVLDRGSYLAMVVPRVSLLDDADKFSLLETHSLWVHRSLTRHFCVLRKG